MTEDQLHTDLKAFVATAGDVVRDVQKGKGTIGKLLKDPKAADALEASLRNLETMTRQINGGEGSIGRLLKDDALYNETTASMMNCMVMSRRLAPSARRMPISRVRSVTVASMMFMMPMPPTTKLKLAMPTMMKLKCNT
jgi:hypothetical protein